MKSTFKVSLLYALLVLSVTGCSRENHLITSLSMLEDKVFAVPAGTAADQMVLDRFPEAGILYFN
ncbi:MAG: hypothetical protein WCY73_04770, partial [Bacteroidales bacterium]